MISSSPPPTSAQRTKTRSSIGIAIVGTTPSSARPTPTGRSPRSRRQGYDASVGCDAVAEIERRPTRSGGHGDAERV